jgi:hypothetical protein
MKRSKEVCCACLIVSSTVWSQTSASYLLAHATTSWKYFKSLSGFRLRTSITDSLSARFHSSVLQALAWLMYVPVDIAKLSRKGEIWTVLAAAHPAFQQTHAIATPTIPPAIRVIE